MKLLIRITAITLFLVFVFPPNVFAAADAYVGQEYPNVCVGDEIPQEGIGGMRLPVAPKYKDVIWGPLFTADDCGEARLQQFFDGEDGINDTGSIISFKRKPSKTLRRLLKVIGYQQEPCQSGAANCKLRYKLDQPTEHYKFLLLKPYAKTLKRIIKHYDCINCG